MTNNEAIEELKAIKSEYSNKAFGDSRLMRSEIEALDMAIKALEQEPSGDLISRDAVIEIIHLFFTEEVDKIPTKKTEDGEVLVIRKCQPLFEMNKAICKRIKALPSASQTQNCVGNALDMRCEDAISRDTVLDAIEELKKIHFDRVVVLNKVRDRVLELPSVNPQEPKGKCLLSQKYRDWQFIQEPKTGHWISVSERLPEDLEPVNITWVNHEPEPYYHDIKNKNFVATGIHYRGQWYWYSTTCADYLGEYGSNDIDKVDDAVEIVAWMPLPIPYEPQESDHKCHDCKHYTSGEHDGSCDSYICEHYSNWEVRDKE